MQVQCPFQKVVQEQLRSSQRVVIHSIMVLMAATYTFRVDSELHFFKAVPEENVWGILGIRQYTGSRQWYAHHFQNICYLRAYQTHVFWIWSHFSLWGAKPSGMIWLKVSNLSVYLGQQICSGRNEIQGLADHWGHCRKNQWYRRNNIYSMARLIKGQSILSQQVVQFCHGEP